MNSKRNANGVHCNFEIALDDGLKTYDGVRVFFYV